KHKPKIANNIVELVGNTPLVSLKQISKSLPGNIVAKLEYFNPMSSVKDRVGAAMIEAAEKSGLLKKGMTVIEPTSGNTGIALAFVTASKGYELVITMPDTMSIERQKIMKALEAHRQSTAVEIWEDTEGEIDILVSAVGTGGTIT
ncbi:hypothetical protein EGW08_022566, partial [Elysia chlorotica]